MPDVTMRFLGSSGSAVAAADETAAATTRVGTAAEGAAVKTKEASASMVSSTMKMMAGFVGLTVGIKVLADIAHAGEGAVSANKLLESSMRNLGLSYSDNIAGINKYIASLSALAGFSKTELTNMFTRMVSVTHDVAKAQRDLADAADLARFRNMSLAQATQTMIRAQEGSVGLLKRQGIVIVPVTAAVDALKNSTVKYTAEQLKAAKAADLAATGEKAVAAVHHLTANAAANATTATEHLKTSLENAAASIGTKVVNEFNKAAAVIEHFIGQWDQAGTSANHLHEAVDIVVGTIKTMYGVIDTVVGKLGGWKTAIELVVTAFLAIKASMLAQAVAGIIASLASVVTSLGLTATATLVESGVMVTGWDVAMAGMAAATTVAMGVIRAALITTGIGALIVLVGVLAYEVYTHFNAIKAFVVQWAPEIGAAVTLAFGGPVLAAIVLLAGLIYQHFGEIKKVVLETASAIAGAFEHPIRTIESAFGALKGVVEGVFRAVTSTIISALNGIIDAYNKIAGWLTGNIPKITDPLKKAGTDGGTIAGRNATAAFGSNFHPSFAALVKMKEAAVAAAAAAGVAAAAAFAQQVAASLSTTNPFAGLGQPGSAVGGVAPSPSGAKNAGSPAQTAVYYAGLPGANTPTFHISGEVTPYDCSAFVQAVFANSGVQLGRSSEAQYQQGQKVPCYGQSTQGELQPGDVVFFQYPGDNASPGHVGIYVGGGMIVQDEGKGGGVQQMPLDWSHYVGARRMIGAVVPTGGGAATAPPPAGGKPLAPMAQAQTDLRTATVAGNVQGEIAAWGKIIALDKARADALKGHAGKNAEYQKALDQLISDQSSLASLTTKTGAPGKAAATAVQSLAAQIKADTAVLKPLIAEINDDVSKKLFSPAIGKALEASGQSIKDALAHATKFDIAGIKTRLGELKTQIAEGLAQALDQKKIAAMVKDLNTELKDGLLPASFVKSMSARLEKDSKELGAHVMSPEARKKIEDDIKAAALSIKQKLAEGLDFKTIKVNTKSLTDAVVAGMFPPELAAQLKAEGVKLHKAVAEAYASGDTAAIKAADNAVKAWTKIVQADEKEAAAVGKWLHDEAASWTKMFSDDAIAAGVALTHIFTSSEVAGVAAQIAALKATLAHTIDPTQAANIEAQIQTLTDSMNTGLQQMITTISNDRQKVAQAWTDFGTVVDAAIQKDHDKFQNSINDLSASFDAKELAQKLLDDTAVFTKALGANTQTASLMQANVDLWKKYYAALKSGNASGAATIQTQIEANAALINSALASGVDTATAKVIGDLQAKNDKLWKTYYDDLAAANATGAAKVKVQIDANNASIAAALAGGSTSSGVDPAIASLMQDQVKLWKQYYDDIAAGNFDGANALQDQIVADEEAVKTALAGLTGDQLAAAGAVVDAGNTLIGDIKAQGATLTATAVKNWQELSDAQKVAIDQAITDAQKAVENGQPIEDALQGLRAVFIANGLSPADADKVLADPITTGLATAVKALKQAVDDFTILLYAMAKVLGITLPDPTGALANSTTANKKTIIQNLADIASAVAGTPISPSVGVGTGVTAAGSSAGSPGSYDVGGVYVTPTPPKGTGGACFVGETLVGMPGGSRRIDEITVGDTVLVHDFTLGKLVPTQVEEVQVHRDGDARAVIEITAGGHIVLVTAEHPFWDGQEWVAAGSLRPGAVIAAATGSSLTSVTVMAVRTLPGLRAVYNLHVAHDDHNYVANGFLVHNVKMAGMYHGGIVQAAVAHAYRGLIVPGAPQATDYVPILANGGEMMLDGSQQTRMFKLLSGAIPPGGGWLGGGFGGGGADWTRIEALLGKLLAQSRTISIPMSFPQANVDPFPFMSRAAQAVTATFAATTAPYHPGVNSGIPVGKD